MVAARSRAAGDPGEVDWRLVVATVPGALAGAWALSMIPSRLALGLLALLTGWVGLRVLVVRPVAAPRGRAAQPVRSLPLGFTIDRVIVYDRDSTVYLRTVDPDGAWSRELMISDPADTVLVAGKRTASNFFPAVALLRDGSARARVVWERESIEVRIQR